MSKIGTLNEVVFLSVSQVCVKCPPCCTATSARNIFHDRRLSPRYAKIFPPLATSLLFPERGEENNADFPTPPRPKTSWTPWPRRCSSAAPWPATTAGSRRDGTPRDRQGFRHSLAIMSGRVLTKFYFQIIMPLMAPYG